MEEGSGAWTMHMDGAWDNGVRDCHLDFVFLKTTLVRERLTRVVLMQEGYN